MLRIDLGNRIQGTRDCGFRDQVSNHVDLRRELPGPAARKNCRKKQQTQSAFLLGRSHSNKSGSSVPTTSNMSDNQRATQTARGIMQRRSHTANSGMRTSSQGDLLSRWCALKFGSGNFRSHCKHRSHLVCLGSIGSLPFDFIFAAVVKRVNVDAWQKVEEVNGWFNDEYFTIIIIQMSKQASDTRDKL